MFSLDSSYLGTLSLCVHGSVIMLLVSLDLKSEFQILNRKMPFASSIFS